MPNIEAPSGFSKAFGQRLQWARELVEPSREEYARSLDVAVNTIRYIETGERNPSNWLTHVICHSLRITFEYLATGDMRGVDPWLRARLLDAHPELSRRRGSFRKAA